MSILIYPVACHVPLISITLPRDASFTITGLLSSSSPIISACFDGFLLSIRLPSNKYSAISPSLREASSGLTGGVTGGVISGSLSHGNLSMEAVFIISEHLIHFFTFSPSEVVVAGVITSHSPAVCPSASTSASLFVSSLPHKQHIWFARPCSVQVGICI